MRKSKQHDRSQSLLFLVEFFPYAQWKNESYYIKFDKYVKIGRISPLFKKKSSKSANTPFLKYFQDGKLITEISWDELGKSLEIVSAGFMDEDKRVIFSDDHTEKYPRILLEG